MQNALVPGGVLLTSFSVLALQIVWSRLLSVIVSYHYVFAVVSLALLGLGMGGIVAYGLTNGLTHASARGGESTLRGRVWMPRLAALASLSIIVSLVALSVAARSPFVPGQAVVYLLMAAPAFICAGGVLALAFRMYPAAAGRLYGADLLGAALGSAGAVWLLNTVGAVTGTTIIALIMATAALLLTGAAHPRNSAGSSLAGRGVPVSGRAESRFSQAGLAESRLAGSQLAASRLERKDPAVWNLTAWGLAGLVVAGTMWAGVASGRIPLEPPVGRNPDKEIFDALHGRRQGDVIESRWSSFGRTDLVRFPAFPDFMDIYVDGTAGTPMYAFTGDIHDPGPAVQALRHQFPGYFPLAFLEEGTVRHALIIGPGGGRDVLLAWLAGAERITAVEVNQDLVAIVRDWADYNGGIYAGMDHINVVIQEGRHFLKQGNGPYDVIMLTLPVTNTSRSREGFSLTESYLFTVESMEDYMDSLTEDGQLVVVAHDEVAVLRLIGLALEAMGRRGISATDAMRHVYVLGSFPYPVFVLKRTPFDRATAAALLRGMREGGYNLVASYVPYAPPSSGLNRLLIELGRGEVDFAAVQDAVARRGFNVGPVSDDRPFFFQFDVGLPGTVTSVMWASLALWGAMAAGAVTVLGRGPARAADARDGRRAERRERRRLRRGGGSDGADAAGWTALFSLLGVGFMLLEVPLIQRMTLFLGEPSLALSVLLAVLLLGAGLGSFCAQRIPVASARAGMALAAAVAGAWMAVNAFVLPGMVERLLPLALPWRLLAAAAMLAPTGFVTGIPFPLGVRRLGHGGRAAWVPWLWAVNGGGSVVGSALAIALAMVSGITSVVILGAVCYALVALIASRVPEGTPAPEAAGG